MSKTCHMVLMYKYYDLIDKGFKTVEYRQATPYWYKRLKDATHVCFHRGYTSTIMTFEIAKKVLSHVGFEIHLGERVG